MMLKKSLVLASASLVSALAIAACSTDSSGGGTAKIGEPCSSGSDCVDGSCLKDADGTFVCTAVASDGTGDDGGTTAGGGVCPEAAQLSSEVCNPYCASPDNGCAAGELCTFASGGGFACTSDGTQAIGKGCNSETFCAEGGCIDVPDAGNKCAAFCATESGCADGFECGIQVDYASGKTVGMCSEKGAGCSLFTQDCAEEGMACYLTGDAQCLDVGDITVGEECNTANACAEGLICVSDKCHQPCFPGTSGPTEERCAARCQMGFAEIEGVNGVGICSLPDNEPACNLANDDCTEAGEACYYTPDGPRCRPVGQGAATSPCEQSTDCIPGHVCWPGGSTCKGICNQGDGIHNACQSPTQAQCSSLAGGGPGVGYCDE
jgi:hypothetical protein